MLRHAAGADADLELREEARKLFHSGKQLVPCATIPALGELVLVLCRDRVGRTGIGGGIDWLYQKVDDGAMDLFALGPEGSRTDAVAAEIRRRDPRVSSSDALIVACMLEDPKADLLYTTDGIVLENRTIIEIAREQGKNVRELGGR